MNRPAITIPVSVDFTGVTIPPPNTAWTPPMPVCTVAPLVEVNGPTQITWELSSPAVPPGYTLMFSIFTPEMDSVEPIAFAKSPNVNTIVWTGPRPTRLPNNTQVTLMDTDTQQGTFEYTVWYVLVKSSDQTRTYPVPQDPDIQNKGGKKLVITP